MFTVVFSLEGWGVDFDALPVARLERIPCFSEGIVLTKEISIILRKAHEGCLLGNDDTFINDDDIESGFNNLYVSTIFYDMTKDIYEISLDHNKWRN